MAEKKDLGDQQIIMALVASLVAPNERELERRRDLKGKRPRRTYGSTGDQQFEAGLAAWKAVH